MHWKNYSWRAHVRVGEAEGDPEGDGRRTLANGWESRLWRRALERGEFRQAVWEATSINTFCTPSRETRLANPYVLYPKM